MQDYLAPQRLVLRTCTASGTKFFDANANGRRDAGEPGIPRFLIWADYDDDGVRDAGEPFTVTDRRGRYVLSDIRPPGGSYRLREALARSGGTLATSWVCSFPNAGTPGGFADGPGGMFGCGWGPIQAATTPNARRRDFGNWLPARLTVEKRLWPADDPGRFDLTVNGTTVLPAAGDRSTITITLRPGTYDVAETAVPPIDAGAYRSAVACRASIRNRTRVRLGTVYTGLVLPAGGQARCTFVNLRPGSPAIAIDKTGPVLATAGDTLHYTLVVTNPGDVALPAATVHVSDPTCDDPPALADKGGDASPGSLDPGDAWTYECSRKTAAPGEDCATSLVANTASATGTAGGTTVTDEDTIWTTLRCPDEPTPPLPQPIPPGPQPPSPDPLPGSSTSAASSAPPGPAPPPSDHIGVAGLRVSAPAGCITRASQVRLVGTDIARMQVRLDGRSLGSRELEILQSTALPLRRRFAPGRHRVTVRVTFQHGSGAPSVTLTRNVTVCAAPRPQFTG